MGRVAELALFPLGKVPDSEIARRTGCPKGTVSWVRRKLGIHAEHGFKVPVSDPGVAQVSEVLQESVLRALGYYPRQVRDIHADVMNDYGRVSQRSIYRALASLRRQGRVESVESMHRLARGRRSG
jgi:hypothetical protein